MARQTEEWGEIGDVMSLEIDERTPLRPFEEHEVEVPVHKLSLRFPPRR
jgi:hypothetical protein